MTEIQIIDRLANLRGGAYAVMCMGFVLEGPYLPDEMLAKALYYIGSQLLDSIEALMDELEKPANGKK